MNKIVIATIAFILSLSSCYKFHNECDPSVYCDTNQPDSGYIDITVTDVGTNNYVPVTIFEGDIEDNKVVLTDTLYSTTNYYYLPVRKRYSAKAVYRKNGITTYVFDGTKIKVTKFWNCGDRCYEVSDGKLDLQLE